MLLVPRLDLKFEFKGICLLFAVAAAAWSMSIKLVVMQLMACVADIVSAHHRDICVVREAWQGQQHH